MGSVERHVEAIHARSRQTDLEEGRKAGYVEGHKAGYAKAMATFRVTYPCARCGQLLELRAGAEDAVAVADYLSASGWAHDECPKPLDLRTMRRKPEVR